MNLVDILSIAAAFAVTISVTTGTISAQPKEKKAIGSSAHQACASKSRLAATFTIETTTMTMKP